MARVSIVPGTRAKADPFPTVSSTKALQKMPRETVAKEAAALQKYVSAHPAAAKTYAAAMARYQYALNPRTAKAYAPAIAKTRRAPLTRQLPMSADRKMRITSRQIGSTGGGR
jgi:hypothetical protein